MNSRTLGTGALTLALLTLTGCGGGSSDKGPTRDTETPSETPTPAAFQSKTINATDSTRYTYLNLETGEQLALTDAEAAGSTAWHIAFRRNAIKLNGGASGPGKSAGAVVAAQADFYGAAGEPNASVFLNTNADNEQEHLLATYTEPTAFTKESLTTVLKGSGETVGTQMDMGWYWYDSTTHAITVNDSNGWLLRNGEGSSYSRMRTTALSYSRSTGLDVTFSFDTQPTGAASFAGTATFNAHIDPSGGESCFDVESNDVVGCDTSTWDLKLGVSGRTWYLRSNGGVSGIGNGAAFGPVAWTDLSTYTSATLAPNGTSIVRLYTQDATSGIFAEQPWFAYDLDGQHKLHPNYRVYWVTSDSTTAGSKGYQVQVTGYYDDTGTSGHLSLRWRNAN